MLVFTDSCRRQVVSDTLGTADERDDGSASPKIKVLDVMLQLSTALRLIYSNSTRRTSQAFASNRHSDTLLSRRVFTASSISASALLFLRFHFLRALM